LSDTEKTLANAYGVWVEKQNYGRTYMGVERSTFLIDKSGKIKKAWHRVRVPGHVADVLASL
jgi:peroxiredoxin Q/BCP